MVTTRCTALLCLLSIALQPNLSSSGNQARLRALVDMDLVDMGMYACCLADDDVVEVLFTEDKCEKCRIHTNARSDSKPYHGSQVHRVHVRDNDVKWFCDVPRYRPLSYTDNEILNKKLGDLSEAYMKTDSFKWNAMDGAISRKTYESMKYDLDPHYYDLPMNPWGRTGLKGRGLLWRWGPNHAADPIVTRWRRDRKNKVMFDTHNKPLLEFVAIRRKDTGEWAIPGGMVDPGEAIGRTLRREFSEEAMDSLQNGEEDNDMVANFFDIAGEYATKIYEGYVDDPRNTDNAWMETQAYNFHDPDGHITTNLLKLQAGDDAVGVQWMPITDDIALYASHKQFILSTWNQKVDEYEEKYGVKRSGNVFRKGLKSFRRLKKHFT